MSDNMAINGYGNPHAQYYQYPYMQTYATLGNNQGGYQTQTVAQPQDAAVQQKKKSSKAACVILGAVALTGAAFLCHKKGNADLKFFPRLLDGAKVCKDGVVNWSKNVINSAKAQTCKAVVPSATPAANNAINPNLPIISMKEFRGLGGSIINGKEFVTAAGDKFTGAISSSSGKKLIILNGKILNTI